MASRRTTLVHLRFDETADDVAPSDAMGALADLAVVGAPTPAVGDTFGGRGRVLVGTAGFAAVDVTPGASLATRDLTIQALLSWDAAAQGDGNSGTIIARGRDAAASATEYLAYLLEVSNLPASPVCALRLRWQTTAGVAVTTPRAYFMPPAASATMLVTVTRRWISSNEAVVKYFLGDQLIAEHLTAGDIGGATTGTLSVGFRYANVTPGNFFAGVLDEVRVLDYELTPEEIAATYARLVVHQPAGYRAIRDLFPPGAPISSDPSSRIQKLLRLPGQMLGYANAQIDNVRRNQRPSRAYGPVLEEWEEVYGESPRPTDSVDQRRARVVAHERNNAGSSKTGLVAATGELLKATGAQLELLNFSHEIYDPFDDGLLLENLWRCTGIFEEGRSAVTPIAAARFEDGTWHSALLPAGADGRAGYLATSLTQTILQPHVEAGLCFLDWALGNAIFFGLRHDGVNVKLVAERYLRWGSQGTTVLATIGAPPPGSWLRLQQDDPGGGGPGFATGAATATYRASYSSTSETAGFAEHVLADVEPSRFQWCGIYIRTLAGFTEPFSEYEFEFDYVRRRMPYDDRTHCWHLYRDPALPGAPDLVGAELAVQRLAQAHTDGHVIASKALVCDAENNLCDLTPLEGI